MHILGISAFYHDSAACLVKDGIIIAAAQEERFTRKKHDHSFPINAIQYCLKEVGIVECNDGSVSKQLKKGDIIIKVDERFFRPAEVETLLGDYSYAYKELGWQPETKIDELCKEMVKKDLEIIKRKN